MFKFTKDKDNNILKVGEKGGLVLLQLSSEKKWRNIGRFTGGTYIKPVKESNVLRVNRSVGFNETVVRELDPAAIAIVYKGQQYTISIESFWRNSEYLHFKKTGFELQCFIPLSIFGIKGV